MKLLTTIAAYKGRVQRTRLRLLCAILALLFSANILMAQEPILLSPQEADKIYSELTADSVAVEDNGPSFISALPADSDNVISAIEEGTEKIKAEKKFSSWKKRISDKNPFKKKKKKKKSSNKKAVVTTPIVAESVVVAENAVSEVAKTAIATTEAVSSAVVSEIEPEPVKVDTMNVEPEPVMVDTMNVEPEPVKVDTMDVEPEPVKVDTIEVEPEPVKIDSDDIGPEPVMVGDSEPAPQQMEESGEPIPYIDDDEDEDDDDEFEEDEDGNILTADTVAEENFSAVSSDKKDSNPKSQVIRYAKRFWDELEEEADQHKLDISGTKTFDMKNASVSGDQAHFSTENYDTYSGFKMDQSLHLEIDGNINKNSTVHAVLDDVEDEDRKFTVNIEGSRWRFVLGDFPLALEGSKFALFNKEVRGVLAEGHMHDKITSIFLYAQSKGLSRREQFRGAGQQQEYRMQASPIVQESEKVYIDGVKLVRGTDYQVDYEEGIIKFLPVVLPIEITRWIVVEYESDDEDMAFTRNLFGTRQVYTRSEGRSIGITWLKELDHSSPKASGDTASGTITPMEHDIYEADINWGIGHGFTLAGEYAVSRYDPNRKSDETDDDKVITGHAASIALKGKNDRIDSTISYDRVDSKYKTIGREDGVVELGERGLVDDIISGKADLVYHFDKYWRGFADGEKSKTNIDNDPTKSKIDFEEFNGGFVWERDADNRFEIRGGRLVDSEYGPDINSDMTKDSSSVVYDKKIGRVKTQAKAERIAYKDDVNVASDSEVVELDLNFSGEAGSALSWNAGVSRITVDDEIVINDLRSETTNYNLDLTYEPSRKFSVRGEFQFRRADDFYDNSREDSKLADSQLVYEPNDDLKTVLKYKVENTSKITKDPSLDPTKYILPSSLPESVKKEDEVLNRFENPVEKITKNFTTDYRISRNLSAYVDWRRRDIDDKKTELNLSKTDRQTYELRYTPHEKMSFTTEYERGFTLTHDTTESEFHDWLKSFQFRNEFRRGYILDAIYEETNEDDYYENENDKYKKSKILELQRPINNKVTLEFGLQHNDITSVNPSTEFEKRFAVTLTPSSRNQRYKFFFNHKDIDAEKDGKYYEGGVTFSQFIGTDTMIDGELKKVHSSPTIDGDGYDATVANAKVVITF